MKKHKRGFTLVEVTLFLGLTALLFAGLIAGMNSSLEAQRFNDATQNFAEFLRSIYSQVSNVQSAGSGRSEYAIYGKLVSFGQNTDLNGDDLGGEQKVFVYDIIGDAKMTSSGSSASDVLGSLNANVVKLNRDTEGNITGVEFAGLVESYSPRWGAAIETVDGQLFKGSIIVVRHPRSGVINTFVCIDPDECVIEVNEQMENANAANAEDIFNYVRGSLNIMLGSFDEDDLNFCINPNGAGVPSDMRRDVRLVANARNGSGVEIIDMDLNEKIGITQIGNRCRFD